MDMYLNEEEENIAVCLAEVSDDLQHIKEMIQEILFSAQMQIVPLSPENNPQDVLYQSKCSLHILGNSYSETVAQHLQVAMQHHQENEDFKIFLWQIPSSLESINDQRQEQFINQVRNSIYRNMIYSNHESPVMLAEDIRSIMTVENKVNFDVKSTEIFFIYNEIDEDSVKTMGELLGDVASVRLLNIIQNTGTDYAELISQQVSKSEMTVIFFKRSRNWALPFVQQVWKRIGGASAASPILFIGDGNHEQNNTVVFEAPCVTSVLIPEELVPLEIKVQYDKIKNPQS